MLRAALGVLVAALALSGGARADDTPATDATTGDTIIEVAATTRKTATQCEAAVTTECQTNTCPTYCATLDAGGDECKTACKTTRCTLRLFGAQDQADNLAVDAQNREQFLACVNENKEPGVGDRVPAPAKAKKAKKHTAGWKKRETATFKARKAKKKKEKKT